MRYLAVMFAIGCSAPSVQAPPPPRQQQPPVVEPVPMAAPVPPGLRLPGDVRPISYTLELTIVPEAQTASGKVHVDARVERPTRVVWMHAAELTIGEARLAGRPARVVTDGDRIGLVADRELTGEVAIDVAFTAPIDRTRSRGIYAEREGAEAYVYTFFEPIDARRAFPCFDEPSYKVPWQLTFHVKQGHVALANAPVVREVDEPDGMKRVELAVTKPLPSYLVAFVVGPFEVIDGGVGGRVKTPIRFIVPQGRAGELGWAKDVTPRVVAALERYFDMDYPFGKLDVAVVPRYWGTMEHPGIVAMGQPLTLIRPDQATRSRKQRYANILAHELAHYWFGDVVTMAWWDDTWLNEALGEWLDLIITDAVEPGWRVRDSRVGISGEAMGADEALSTRQMRQPVTTGEGIAASFDNDITYSKGASVFRMFEAWVGEERWRDFLREYIRAHAWGNASAEDLLGLAKVRLGAPVEAGLRSFLEQPGVPVISARATCPRGKPAKIELHQTRSLPAGVTEATSRTWKVPVCIRYGDATGSAQRCVQLDGADGEMMIEDHPVTPAERKSRRAVPAPNGAWHGCPTWMIVNANATGYYRSAVDAARAKALLEPGSAIARVARPTPAERMMLVTDLRAAVNRGELAIEKVLALVPAVAADPDERVAQYAFEAGSMRAGSFDDALYAKAQRFYLASFGPAARRLGWKRAPGDSDERHQLRRSFVGAVARLDPVLAKQAEQLADAWLARLAAPAGQRAGELEDDLVGVVLATVAFRGGKARFEQLLDAANHAPDRTERQRLLRVLGNFREPALVARALGLVLGKDLDLRDSLGIMFGTIVQRDTRDLGLAFVKDHLDELLARMRDDESAGLLGGLAGAFCDPARRAEIEQLVVPRAARIDGAQAAVARGLEESAQCIASVRRELPAITRFLARY